MSNKKINRIKVMLAEKEKTNKWLAENGWQNKWGKILLPSPNGVPIRHNLVWKCYFK